MKKVYKTPVIRSESIEVGVFGCYGGVERTGPLFGSQYGFLFSICCGDNALFPWF